MKNLLNKINKIITSLNIEFDYIDYIAGDASNRKYFKIFNKNLCKILMYDDNGKESINNFLHKTYLFDSYGLRVPKIFSAYSESGIIVMESFGDSKFSKIINHKNELLLYKSALDSLIFIHKKNKSDKLTNYTKEVFFDESKIFFEWYLRLNSFKKKKYKLFDFKNTLFNYLGSIENLPLVNVHRDFHVDNLFYLDSELSHKKCGWIDYQDALVGPIVYDVMSLLEDARRDLKKGNKEKLIFYYIEKANILDKNSFLHAFKIVAIQRHLKVLGIFARLAIRDKKPDYIKHIPRVLKMLKDNLSDSKCKEMETIIKPLIKE